MDETTLRYDVFQTLYEAWVENVESPERFVGMQGDKIVIMQPGGEHYVLLLVPATVGAPA